MSLLAAFMVPHPPMLLPEVGKGREAMLSETLRGYERVAERIASLAPDTIVISSPHGVAFPRYFNISTGETESGSLERFGAPGVRLEVPLDTIFSMQLAGNAEKAGIEAGAQGCREACLDHGTLIPLWFILQKYKSFRLVRIGRSGHPMSAWYALGMEIQAVSSELNRRTVFIASGDLSHKLKENGPYGFDPAGPEYDFRITGVMERADFGELFGFDAGFLKKASQCGHNSFAMLAGTLDSRPVRAEKLSYQDVTGVGYAICAFEPLSDTPEPSRAFLDKYLKQEREKLKSSGRTTPEDLYVRLAGKALEAFVLSGRRLWWDQLKQDFPNPGEELSEDFERLGEDCPGTAVTLLKNGAERTRCGIPHRIPISLADEIIDLTITAGSEDPDFPPVRPEDLPGISCRVEILQSSGANGENLTAEVHEQDGPASQKG
ncbi:MAG: AMMECR1 domain-containing protein [Lachnospiraceae bacterium]|nr:AMMECR1 domain-containing protein [Lachnospiraceae bacterium]